VNRRLILGGEIDIMERPPSGTNIYYSALASWYLFKTLELHGKISICPAPTFAATQIYSGGAAWQALPRLGLLLDYQHYNFIWGPIDQINPGLVWSFSDESWLTLRYVRGWAFYNLEYNYYSAALNIALPGKRRLTMAFAYGTDPDAQIGADGTTQTNLSPAYTYSLFLTQPLTRDLNLFAGIQYCYRLTKYGGGELYEQITPTLGCTLQFLTMHLLQLVQITASLFTVLSLLLLAAVVILRVASARSSFHREEFRHSAMPHLCAYLGGQEGREAVLGLSAKERGHAVELLMEESEKMNADDRKKLTPIYSGLSSPLHAPRSGERIVGPTPQGRGAPGLSRRGSLHSTPDEGPG